MAKLMTVGELAKHVGVTVRTIQYYDQKGLLHPTQIGEANQRLYSESDEMEMRRILVLKYLGLSLSDIANRAISTKEDFEHAVRESEDMLSQEIVRSFERMSALKALTHAFENEDEVDWAQATTVIGLVQSNSELFWEHIAGCGDGPSTQTGFSRRETLAWHTLMGETIEAMQQNIAPQSERGITLGARYRSLSGRERALQGFALMDEPGKIMSSMDDRGRAFYQKLQKQALEYLDQASSSSLESGA